MLLSYFIITAVIVNYVAGIINTIVKKSYYNLIILLLILPFYVFFISSLVFGGDAFNDAANNYALYQQGHYYLCSHGAYTEVSYGVYLYMQIIQVIATTSFLIGTVLALIERIIYRETEIRT